MHSSPLCKTGAVWAGLLWLALAAGGIKSPLLHRNTYAGVVHRFHPFTNNT